MQDIDPDEIFTKWMDMQGMPMPKGHNYKL